MREPYSEYHPFGPNFILRPWNIPNEKIDKYEPKPYTRIPMTIVNVPETTIADTPAQIQGFMLLRLKAALELEFKGMKCHGPSAYSQVKKLCGFTGNKKRVYWQLVNYLRHKRIIP